MIEFKLSMKAYRKLWYKIVSILRDTKLYPFIYVSYWHYIFSNNKNVIYLPTKELYYAAWPNQGAGIGHQIDVWCNGYFIAKDWGLKFAYLPFSKEKWDTFLGFEEGEVTVEELRNNGYKIRKLPYFNVDNLDSIKLNKQIIASYQGEKIVFIAEVDQHFRYSVVEKVHFIKNKFLSSPSRVNDTILYNKKNYNIAIHIRRGDIMDADNNPNLKMRYLSNNYYLNVLKQVIENIKTDKPIYIYLFSQGKPEDFPEFDKYKNLIWCFNVNAQNSFANLVYADLIITSKSSFSYDPALMNNGIKLCPNYFWGEYPKGKDWILCDEERILDTLTSVSSQIFKDFEYIIIDGKSTDNTLKVIETSQCKVDKLISEKDGGIYDAMNKGASISTGQWILFLNAGDTFYSDRVLSEIDCENIDSFDVVYGKNMWNYVSYKKESAIIPLHLMDRTLPFCHQASIVKRELLLRYPFDLQYKIIADYDFFRRVYFAGARFHFLPIIFVNYLCTGGVSADNTMALLFENFKITKSNPFFMRILIFIKNVLKYWIVSFLKVILPNTLIHSIRSKGVSTTELK